MSKDYYQILGVPKNANSEEIKKAFRRLAHQYHPDKGNGDEVKFKEVNEAYQVLGNEQKRRQYDQFGSTFDQAGFASGQNPFSGWDFSSGFNPQTGGFSDIDIDEIFGDFFGSFRRGGTRQASQTRRGRDLEISMAVDFAAAALGSNKKIKITKEVLCPVCHGWQAKDKSSIKTCSDCNGRGRQTHLRQTFLGNIQTQTVCATCQGAGKIIKEKCPKCAGQGLIRTTQQVDINIPGGVENGQRLRLGGEGSDGLPGANPGDLYVNITVQTDPQFERSGETIYSSQLVPFSLATLGGKINVSVVDGMVRLKIPAGTPSGEKFRLRNKGAKRLGSLRRGDHVVTVKVAVPDRLNSRQKQLIKELADQDL